MKWRRGRPDTHTLDDQLAILRQVDKVAGTLLHQSTRAAIADVLRRSEERRAVAPDHTVVALAGTTGSGKSSLFNALTESTHAKVSVKRPTTSQTLGGAVDSPAVAGLYDFLGVNRSVALPSSPLQGRDEVVLLDLPDIDSVAQANRQEAARLTEVVDVLVWVMDPQKYADHSLHAGFLTPLARHADVSLVVLNKIDQVPVNEQEQLLRHLRSLLPTDSYQVITTSTQTGQGIAEVREVLDSLGRQRNAATARLNADVAQVLHAVRGELSLAGAGPAEVSANARAKLQNAVAQAAGIPLIETAVQRSYLRRAARHYGMPEVRWLSRLRPDPVDRLHLGQRGAATSLPAPSHLAVASVERAARQLVEASRVGVAPELVEEARVAAMAGVVPVADTLDGVIAADPLPDVEPGGGWRALGTWQWLCFLAVLGGVGLLVVGAITRALGLPWDPTTLGHLGASGPLGNLPLATALLGIGVGGGLLGWIGGRLVAAPIARRRAHQVGKRLRKHVVEVTDTHLVEPVEQRLGRWNEILALLV